MYVIIKLSEAGMKAEAAKPREDQVHYDNRNGDYSHSIRAETPEQQAVCDALELKDNCSLELAFTGVTRLGNLTPSKFTRQPLLAPIAYDAPPTNEEVWQQLAVMAQQRVDMLNPSGMKF